MTTTGSMRNPHLDRPDLENSIDMLAGELHAELRRLDAIAAELKTAKGHGREVWLEFLDEIGSEGISPTHVHGDERWKRWEGPIPGVGDIVVADYGMRYRVVGFFISCQTFRTSRCHYTA